MIALPGPYVMASLAPFQHHVWKTRGDRDYVGKKQEETEFYREEKVISVEINAAVTAVAFSEYRASSGKLLGSKAVKASAADLLLNSSTLAPEKVFLHIVFRHHHHQLCWLDTQCQCFLA